MNRAIALRYDEATDQAPVVVAGGDGALAQMIARAAGQVALYSVTSLQHRVYSCNEYINTK